jgi:hypothetical protein
VEGKAQPVGRFSLRIMDGVVTVHGQVERRGTVPLAIHLTWSVDPVDQLTFA